MTGRLSDSCHGLVVESDHRQRLAGLCWVAVHLTLIQGEGISVGCVLSERVCVGVDVCM